MRTLTGTANTAINKRTATEPIIVVEIFWNPQQPRRYSDKNHQNAKGKIISISNFESIIKLRGGQSTTISLVLDDTDEDIKTLLKTVDPHEVSAIIYQSYDSFNSTVHNFILFKGKLNSPVVWNEGSRTVNLTIVSDIESREVGFSPESGFFEFVDPSIIGKPWPICFGEVVRVPAQRITPRIEGTSLTRYKPITNDILTNLEEKVKKYTLILAEIGITDNILDIEDIEIIILNDDYIGLLEEIAKAYREFTTILEELVISNPVHEFRLNLFVRIIIDLTLRKRQIEKITQFVNGTTAKRKILNDEIEDLNDAKITEEDKTPFEDQQIIFGIVNVIAPLEFQLVGLDSLISALIGLQDDILFEIGEFEDGKQSLIDAMTVFELNVIDFFSTEPWPQGEQTIIVNKQQLTGTVSGTQFILSGIAQALDLEPVNMTTRQNSNPNEFWISNWASGETPQLRNRYCLVAGNDFGGELRRRVIFVTQQEGNHCYFSPIIYEERGTINDRITYGFKLFNTGDTIEQQSSVFLSDAWIGQLTPQPADPADWVNGLYQLMVADWSLELGDPISHTSSFDEIHIANLYESDSVDEVMAYREKEGQRVLMALPTHYYTIDLAFEIGGFTTTAIKLQRPLREYEGENWEDQLYVSLESSLSPNTADVIQWIIETWTDFTIDTSSFTGVNNDLTNFPSNFALLEKRDALDLIEDIAWQARSAVWLFNGVVHIKYLSKEPDIDFNITEDDIEATTLQTTFTTTEELITIVTGEWTADYSLPKKNTIILRNNVPIYGVHKETYNIFIYNIEELVQRTLTFWLIRYSNTWRKIIFDGFMNLIPLEVFDTVLVNVPITSLPPVKTVVENVEYNNNDKSIRLTLWTPIRARFTSVYPFAWMSSAPSNLPYPTSDDPHAGGG